MPYKNSSQQLGKSNPLVTLGLGAVVIFFLASGLVSYLNIRVLNRDTAQVVHTHEVILALDDLLSILKDAETGQRGFLITGNENYLDPYNEALTRIETRIDELEHLVGDNVEQTARMPAIVVHIHKKLAELGETVSLRRTQGFDAARAVVITDLGKNEMDALRMLISKTRAEQQMLRAQRLAEMDDAYNIAVVSGILASLLGMLLSMLVALLLRRTLALQQREDWLQSGQVKLSAAMIGEQRVEQLAHNILAFLAEYMNAQAGAFFVKQGQHYTRVATYGMAANSNTVTEFTVEESLLGQAAKEARPFILKDIPDDYLKIGCGLGHGQPRYLVIAPAIVDDMPNAVFELGFLQPLHKLTLELLERLSASIGIAIRSASDRANIQNMLEETQRQSEELQAQGEELRVSNEELEEQSRALKESQTRLEHQQAEMEQTNSQLEEQTQLLAGQRDDLARTKAVVQAKAHELEQASQYKSDFLANMSHELRTPLNSSLILAKLLADNPNHNLTDEQVKFAQTIQSSGNDLLTLINDILDLSKIEAGHMEVRPESVSLERLLNDITRIFDPMAKQKGLIFQTQLLPNCPAIIETDRQRLEQILKNLLSNAIKFTEHGQVELMVSRMADNQIAFAVTDTGIGIAQDQQQAIFDAFRQADGTISRKYGGTGLGLSISRQLTRLLSGTIEITSTVGQGSCFTITLPINYAPAADAITPVSLGIKINSLPAATVQREKPSVIRMRQIEDDRERLINNGRVILIVEDDEVFARILRDLVNELDFQCIVCTTAEDALIAAKQYMPNAVLLDVGLPDNSGLSVLDRLKRNVRTRHIPVHVVSGHDHAQTALSLGAIGHMLKPVKREDLISALKLLETRFAKHMRRILIVEDDAVQRDSMRKLLATPDVETVGVGSAAACLKILKETTFDCMVLDLSLPDTSGYELLETLSKEDAYSFPPVIVYTGRDLSNDEEQRLRRYSKSIIIKGVKSPERLLDEVTLFLHQVVADLPPEQQRMLEKAHSRDAILEGRRILVVEDDVANVYALTSILEPRGAIVQIARNGREALEALAEAAMNATKTIDLVLMDVMMPEVDGLMATREIRKQPVWKKLPIIMLTAKAMRDDQERCLDAGANDYMAKPLDVEKLLSLVRVWMPR